MSGPRAGRRTVLAALATGSVAVVTGCSGDGGDRTTTATTATTGQTTNTETASTATAETTTTKSPGDLTVEAPDATPRDEPIEMAVRGATPCEEVTLRAATVDQFGNRWSSTATFVADDDGTVDLATASPESGTYESADPMGWLWSMDNDSGDEPYVGAADRSIKVDLTVETADDATTVRTVRAGWESVWALDVGADDLVGTICLPEGDGPHPGVLALHGSGGAPPVSLARHLAAHGYATLALQYFGDPDPIPDALLEVPLSYFEDAADWLRARDDVGDRPVGVHGASRGGELALLLGSRFDWVGAVVADVPSGIVWPGFSRTETGPAWVHDGEPVPYLEATTDVRTEDGATSYRPGFENGLEKASAERIAEATIPVEETDGPVLLISGEDDGVWPSTRLSAVAVDRLAGADFEYRYDHLAFQDAGHWIPVPYVPTANRTSAGGWYFGGIARGYARAAAESWPAVLSFLETGLRE